MNDEATQHYQSGDIMHHITDRHRDTWKDMIEPHQDSCNQKQHRTDRNDPEIQFLAAIEESGIFWFDDVRIGRVLLQPANEFAIGAGPGHRNKPVHELQKKEHLESETKPRMQEPC